MSFNIDFVVISQVVIAAVLVIGVKSLIRMSQCLTKLVQWKEDHTEQEGRWHQENKEEHKALRDRLEKIANGTV